MSVGHALFNYFGHHGFFIVHELLCVLCIETAAIHHIRRLWLGHLNLLSRRLVSLSYSRHHHIFITADKLTELLLICLAHVHLFLLVKLILRSVRASEHFVLQLLCKQFIFIFIHKLVKYHLVIIVKSLFLLFGCNTCIRLNNRHFCFFFFRLRRLFFGFRS